jgi:hypothetical protein
VRASLAKQHRDNAAGMLQPMPLARHGGGIIDGHFKHIDGAWKDVRDFDGKRYSLHLELASYYWQQQLLLHG